jgi:hypothetical protein
MNKINTNNISHFNKNILNYEKKDLTQKEQEKKISLRKEKFINKIFQKRLENKNKNKNFHNEINLSELNIKDEEKLFEINSLVKNLIKILIKNFNKKIFRIKKLLKYV